MSLQYRQLSPNEHKQSSKSKTGDCTLVGQTFERLTVIAEAGRRGHNRYWTCQCTCGSTRDVSQSSLLRGLTRSCGCLHNEELGNRRRTHGMVGSNEYSIWKTMIARCHNPNSVAYIKYGAKGVYVSESWKNSFETFYQDMGPRPSKHHSVDRIDPFGPYAKGNCRWATPDVQANNVRSRAIIGHKTFSVAELARAFQMPYQSVINRLNNSWTIYEALTVPPGARRDNRLITFRQVTLSLSDWSRIGNIDPITLSDRLKIGLSMQEALSLTVRPWPQKVRAIRDTQIKQDISEPKFTK